MSVQPLSRWAPRVLRGVALLCLVAGAACRDLLTVAPNDADLFDAPLEGLTPPELAAFARGDAEFGRRFSPTTGLGPIFNDVSCASCHSGDGRGRLDNALVRIGSPADGFLRPIGGPQIQGKAIPGAHAESVPPGVATSLRLPPPVFGTGLIEAIPLATILALADSADRDGDGISGRPNWVLPPSYVTAAEPGGGNGPQLGRFGRKASVSSILQQTVGAYHEDMGITTAQLPDENVNPLAPTTITVDAVADPEVSPSTVQAVVHYLRALAPPAPADDNATRTEGRTLFAQARCTACHTPRFTAGASPLATIQGRSVDLYSDLLLHDMGPELADDRPDEGATGREWRTAPLWGLRLMRRFLNGDAFLMHDGRAHTVDTAIRLHGGEAAASRAAYVALTPAQRSALLAFVESR
ncbi:MAG: thiol oxidoreductase [Gemmatimonadaceae bacterium]|nr:thiol oxidoreductase [Gemmatimonadaceae bacterium]